MTVAITAITAIASVAVSAPNVHVPVVNDFQKFTDAAVSGMFMNQDFFGTLVSWYHSALGQWVPYSSIFDDPSSSVSAGAQVFNQWRPQVQLSESALRHQILKGDQCRTGGRLYSVEDFVSDGVGVITAYLGEI